MSTKERRPGRVAGWLYRALLLAYPARFRRTWGRELVETFRDGGRDAARQGGAALARFWLRTVEDLVRSAAAERWVEHKRGPAMSRQSALYGAFVAGAALVFGWLCLHTDETGILAGSLMLLAFALAFARPRRAWLAAGLGLVAPLVQGLAHLASWRVPYPNDWPQVAGAAVALVFSIVAALGGALCGWAVAQVRRTMV